MNKDYPHIFLNWSDDLPVRKHAAILVLFFTGQMALFALVALKLSHGATCRADSSSSLWYYTETSIIEDSHVDISIQQ
jgi:hypothetical protein